MCIFPNISFWPQSIFFPSFFWNQNWLRFKKILEIKLSDKGIVSKKDERKTKGSRRLNFRKASDGLSSWLPAILIFPNGWNKQILAFNIFCSVLQNSLDKQNSKLFLVNMSCRRHQPTSLDALKIHWRVVSVLWSFCFNALESELRHKCFDQIQGWWGLSFSWN